MKSYLQKGEKEVKNIINIISKKKFNKSGYTGIAIKNSIYQFSTNLVAKIGSLVLTVILARLLMPELFGLYSLALSTIILFASFTDLGLGLTLIKFISRTLQKNQKIKTKSYWTYLLKIKIYLVFIVAIILLISAKFIAENYYNKPIFLALLAGSAYILSMSLIGFIESAFRAKNQLKVIFYKEIFFQVVRLIIIPLAILISLKYVVSGEKIISWIILATAAVYFLGFIYIFFLAKRRLEFLREKKQNLTKKEKNDVNKFVLPLSATVLSGVFFGYIDMVMLGRFVLAEFIAYYRVAFSLIGAIAPLIAFATVLFPIFNRIKGERLKRALKKSIIVNFIISFFAVIVTIAVAVPLVSILYGAGYEQATLLLRILSLLLISLPMISIYTFYLISKGRTMLIAKLLILSTIINIGLNYLAIVWLLNYSQFMAVVGVSISTIISRYFYLILLVFFTKKIRVK